MMNTDIRVRKNHYFVTYEQDNDIMNIERDDLVDSGVVYDEDPNYTILYFSDKEHEDNGDVAASVEAFDWKESGFAKQPEKAIDRIAKKTGWDKDTMLSLVKEAFQQVA